LRVVGGILSVVEDTLMRMKIFVAASVVALMSGAGLANAAPAAARSGIAANPGIVQVRDGCGPGWYMAQWRDNWGRWRQRCQPIQGWNHGWRGGPPSVPYSGGGPWNGPPPGSGYYYR